MVLFKLVRNSCELVGKQLGAYWLPVCLPQEPSSKIACKEARTKTGLKYHKQPNVAQISLVSNYNSQWLGSPISAVHSPSHCRTDHLALCPFDRSFVRLLACPTMVKHLLIVLALSNCVWLSTQTDATARQFWRPGGIPFINALRLQNTACSDDSGETGTCVSEAECKNRQGYNIGVCGRSGLTCCNQKFTCGGKTAKNETLFVNPSYPLGENGTNTCQVTIQNVPNVCQLRLGKFMKKIPFIAI